MEPSPLKWHSHKTPLHLQYNIFSLWHHFFISILSWKESYFDAEFCPVAHSRETTVRVASNVIHLLHQWTTLSLTKEQLATRNKEQRHLRPISHLIFTNEQHHLRPISHGLLLHQWATPSTTHQPLHLHQWATPSTTNQPLHLHQWATPSPHDEECAPTLVDFVNRGNKMSNWLKRAPPPPLPPHSTFFP